MKRLLLLFLLLISYHLSAQTEKIHVFESDIKIQEDGSVIVHEKISVEVHNARIKSGIYRAIPLDFYVNDERRRQKLKVVDVMRNGYPEPYFIESYEGGLRIMVGQKNFMIDPGRHVYEIVYELDRSVVCDDKNSSCELMWNVNGNDWDFGIDSLVAKVYLPNNSKIENFNAWVGKYGSEESEDFESYAINESAHTFYCTNLGRNENLTFSIDFESSVMTPASFNQRVNYFYRDKGLFLIGGLALVLSFLINFLLWLKFGKDPKEGTIIPQFYPPENMSPAELSYLKNKAKPDKNIFAAQLIQLAVKGHVKINSNGDEGRGWFKKKSFTVELIEDNKDKKELNEIEENFLSKLMKGANSITISGKTDKRISLAFQQLIKDIEKKQKGVFYKKNSGLILPQIIIFFSSFILMLYTSNVFGGPWWTMPLVFVSLIVIMVVFLKLIYRPTVRGRQVLDHILGFERFIKYADELRINALNQPDMNFTCYEENLPYAIAFGQSEKWSQHFPAEVLDDGFKTSSRIGRFTSSSVALGAISSVSSVAASSQKSSIASSRSGGGSSGGFSGGGAGGGGGGGW